jgi:hypothetical protein
MAKKVSVYDLLHTIRTSYEKEKAISQIISIDPRLLGMGTLTHSALNLIDTLKQMVREDGWQATINWINNIPQHGTVPVSSHKSPVKATI